MIRYVLVVAALVLLTTSAVFIAASVFHIGIRVAGVTGPLNPWAIDTSLLLYTGGRVYFVGSPTVVAPPSALPLAAVNARLELTAEPGSLPPRVECRVYVFTVKQIQRLSLELQRLARRLGLATMRQVTIHTGQPGGQPLVIRIGLPVGLVAGREAEEALRLLRDNALGVIDCRRGGSVAFTAATGSLVMLSVMEIPDDVVVNTALSQRGPGFYEIVPSSNATRLGGLLEEIMEKMKAGNTVLLYELAPLLINTLSMQGPLCSLVNRYYIVPERGQLLRAAAAILAAAGILYYDYSRHPESYRAALFSKLAGRLRRRRS